jgi:WD40 repeat protein
MNDTSYGLAAEETAVFASNMQRMTAAYRLRLAKHAQAIGAEPPNWEGGTASIDVEKRTLLPEDQRRIEPYPYPGLRSFDPGEGEIFFGRDRDIEAVRSLLSRDRVVAVLGGSGSGKSSLLRAGLLPFVNTKRRLEGRFGNWYRTEFRPRTKPLHELASALAEQLMLPLLRMRKANGGRLGPELGFWSEDILEVDEEASRLQALFGRRFTEAHKVGRQAVFDAFAGIAWRELDRADNIVTGGRRLAEPSLFLLVDQLEEVFRPEVCADEREALLNLIVDLHDAAREKKGNVYLALTIRSEELHRCAEHRGLSNIAIGNGYQLELLEPADPKDRIGLRLAIVQPARNVFKDWGLSSWLKQKDEEAKAKGMERDAPFSPGMPDLLLSAAERLSKELKHRPDQLPLLQHALQAIWHSAMKRWSRGVTALGELEIRAADLPGHQHEGEIPDLGECLNRRADDASHEAAERFASIGTTTTEIGEQALRAAFRALARRDDITNWARRFASRDDITAFLAAEPNSVLAGMHDDLRWTALQKALNSFLLRGYLNRGRTGDHDISHEALIRNWKKFQLWLRDPREVAYILGRVLKEVEEPEKFESLSDREKVDLIPQTVTTRVAMVTGEGQLPTRWAEDQIEPILQNSATRARWGSSKSEALKRVIALAGMADAARKKLELAEFFRNWGALGASVIAIFAISAVVLLWTLISQKNEAEKWANFNFDRYKLAKALQGTNESYYFVGRPLSTYFENLRDFARVDTGLAKDATRLALSRARENIDQAQNSLTIAETNQRKLLSGLEQFNEDLWRATNESDRAKIVANVKSTLTSIADPQSKLRLAMYAVAAMPKNQDEGVTAILRDAVSNSPQVTLRLPGATQTWGIAFDPRDNHRAAVGDDNGVVWLWDPLAYSLVPDQSVKLLALSAAGSLVNGLAFNENGSLLAAAYRSSGVVVWELSNSEGKVACPLQPIGQSIGAYGVAFHGSVLAIGGGDSAVHLWDASTCRDKGKIFPRNDVVFGVAISGDGGMLAAASGDGSVVVWDIDNPEIKFLDQDIGKPMFAVAFSRDGKMLAATGADGIGYFWEIQHSLSGVNIKPLNIELSRDVPEARRSVLGQISFSKDEDKVVATARSYSTDEENVAAAAQISLSKDKDEVLATARRTAPVTAVVTDTRSFQENILLRTGRSSLFGVAFSPDSKNLLISSNVTGAVGLFFVGSAAPIDIMDREELLELGFRRLIRTDLSQNECKTLASIGIPIFEMSFRRDGCRLPLLAAQKFRLDIQIPR